MAPQGSQADRIPRDASSPVVTPLIRLRTSFRPFHDWLAMKKNGGQDLHVKSGDATPNTNDSLAALIAHTANPTPNMRHRVILFSLAA